MTKLKWTDRVILQDRYVVSNKIGQGSFGSVFKVVDISDPNRQSPLVVKFSQDAQVLENEVTAIDQVHRHAESHSQKYDLIKSSIPVNHAKGVLLLDHQGKLSKSTSVNTRSATASQNDTNGETLTDKITRSDANEPIWYFIMPRYGVNLQQLLEKCSFRLSNASIFHLGIRLLSILELIHNSGLVYNDLKPDNIMIGFHRERIPDLSTCQ